MRLWSIHPKYLDAKGLTALWREGLLAQKVLLGETQGYRHHPQLIRFRQAEDPVAAIGVYLRSVVHEATRRGYHFAGEKIVREEFVEKLTVTTGQVDYEWEQLQTRLKRRAPQVYAQNQEVRVPDVHPIFNLIPGEVEGSERVHELS